MARGGWAAAVVGLGILAGSGLGAYHTLFRRPLPRRQGVLTLPGLEAAADVIRDPWGIPHIRAATLNDAYAAQGFVHAQDRLWQLDICRRTGSGRLAEIFGKRALPADRFLRRIALRPAAEKELACMAPAARAHLEAYSRGVNAGIAATRALPIEFRVLRYRPEPWTPLDSLTYSKLLSWSLSANWETELLRARILARIGPALAARLEPSYPADHPLTTSPGARAAVADLLADFERAAPFIVPLASSASNAWAVSGNRSATGAPLLATDPHLVHRVPSSWYEIHMTSPETDVVGASIVSLPGVLIGHNGHISWGLTAAPVDVQDLYLERLDPSDATRYETNGTWQSARVVEEVISVRGQKQPAIEEVRITRHGPIITSLRTETAALALCWTLYEQDRFLETVTAVNQARDWPAMRQALAGLAGPPINVISADAAGNIAYQLAGHIPTRPHGGGLLPSPGWTDEYEWGPPIPFDDLPHSVNPPDGAVVSANNCVVGADYPYYLGHEWANGYRARRITDLLAERERHTLADFARMQLDVLSLPGLRLKKRLMRLPAHAFSPRARQALDLLRAWDGEMRAESSGAAVYGRLMPTIQRRLFEPVFGEVLNEYLGIGQHDYAPLNLFVGRSLPLALDLLDDPALGGLANALLDGRSDLSPADALLVAALEETTADLHDLLGPSPATWRWGALNRVGWRHPLGLLKPLVPLLNRGPFELAGDGDTINMATTIPFMPAGEATQAWLPGYRLIVDLADPSRSVSQIATGQSGLPLSPHYADQIGGWRSGRPHALLYERTAIDRAAIDRLLLVPD